MKILLAVDGSAYTKKMLAYLSTHEALFSTAHDYTVFTACHPVPARAASVVGKQVIQEHHTEEAERVFAPVAKFLLRHGIDAKTAWRTGPPGLCIAKFAEAGKYDLVVMGSHGHGTLVNLVTGSVATQVLAACRVPVLLVR
jgi:nucleotide-binding universal stress UspA family protein